MTNTVLEATLRRATISMTNHSLAGIGNVTLAMEAVGVQHWQTALLTFD